MELRKYGSTKKHPWQDVGYAVSYRIKDFLYRLNPNINRSLPRTSLPNLNIPSAEVHLRLIKVPRTSLTKTNTPSAEVRLGLVKASRPLEVSPRSLDLQAGLFSRSL